MELKHPPIDPVESTHLVTRDAESLEEIDARMVAHVHCDVLTPYVGRILRREYNWLARKMYLRSRSDDRWRKQALRCIDDLAAEITMLGVDIEHLDRWPHSPLSCGSLTVRVIDATSSRLLVQLKRLDASAAILYRAQIYGNALSTPERWERIGPVARSLSRLTNHCLGAVDAERVAKSVASLSLSD